MTAPVSAIALIVRSTTARGRTVFGARTTIIRFAVRHDLVVRSFVDVVEPDWPAVARGPGAHLAVRSGAGVILVHGTIDAARVARVSPTLPVPLAPVPSGDAPLWCGRVDLTLFDRRGLRVAALDLAVHPDTVTTWWLDRTLAVYQRDQLLAWMVRPENPLWVDDVLWAVSGGRHVISVDGSPGYRVSDPDIRRLVSVL